VCTIEGDQDGQRVPMGFPTSEWFAQFREEFEAVLTSQGTFEHTGQGLVACVGSAARGWSLKSSTNGEPPDLFPFGDDSDCDVIMVIPDLNRCFANKVTVNNLYPGIYKNTGRNGFNNTHFGSAVCTFANTWNFQLGFNINIKLATANMMPNMQTFACIPILWWGWKDAKRIFS